MSNLSAETLWLIWSNEHRCWWRENRCGYTSVAADAGQYSIEEAIQICRNADYRAGSLLYGTTAPPETMVPASFLGTLESRTEYDRKRAEASR